MARQVIVLHMLIVQRGLPCPPNNIVKKTMRSWTIAISLLLAVVQAESIKYNNCGE